MAGPPPQSPVLGSPAEATQAAETTSGSRTGQDAGGTGSRPGTRPAGSGKRTGRTGTGKKRPPRPEAKPETWADRVQKQLHFYFSDANLRHDFGLRSKMEEGQGFVDISHLLQFNRLKALKCHTLEQVAQAVHSSPLLVLSEDGRKLGRNPSQGPVQDIDPTPRVIYVEGLPLTFNIDDVTLHFSRYGTVRLVHLPRHPETGEPRGFGFVEFDTEQEATEAAAAVNGRWPRSWPQRFDGKVVKAMPKREWLSNRLDYQALSLRVRGRSGRGLIELPGTTNPSTGLPTLTSGGRRPGCLVHVSDFTVPQTVLSIRQFVEHVVPVEYCDYPDQPGNIAHVRLRQPEDCQALLEDLRLSGRMLGWRRPEVRILNPEDEAKYWEEAAHRRATRDAQVILRPPLTSRQSAAYPGLSKAASRRMQRPYRLANPLGVIRSAPRKGSELRLWPGGIWTQKALPGDAPGTPPEAGAMLSSFPKAMIDRPIGDKACFLDIVCGNAGFTQAGFGKAAAVRRKSEKYAKRRQRRGAPERAPASVSQQPKVRLDWLPPPTPLVEPQGFVPMQRAASTQGGGSQKEGQSSASGAPGLVRAKGLGPLPPDSPFIQVYAGAKALAAPREEEEDPDPGGTGPPPTERDSMLDDPDDILSLLDD